MPEVDSDELINQAIEARKNIEAQRSEIQSRRSALINQLKRTPGGRGTSHLASSINAEIRALDLEERHLYQQEHFTDTEARTRMTAAFRNASMADKHLEMQRHTQTAEQASNILLGMADIEAKYKHGTPEFQGAVTNLVGQNPLGMNAAQARKRVLDATTFHDKETERMNLKAASDLQKTTGLTPEQFAALDHGTQVKAGVAEFDKSGKLKTDFSTDTKPFIPPEYQNTQWEKIPADVRSKINENITKGGAIQIDTGQYKVVIPRTQYENFKNQFISQPTGMVTTTSQPQTADEMAQNAGYRSAAQVQGYDAGKPLLDFAPPGTVSLEKSKPIEPGKLPGGGYFSNAPLPRSTVPQTPEGGREEINREIALQGQQGTQPSVQPTVQATPQPSATPNHQAAVEWAKANPTDPRSKRILELNPQ